MIEQVEGGGPFSDLSDFHTVFFLSALVLVVHLCLLLLVTVFKTGNS